jgi:hypothetical protein
MPTVLARRLAFGPAEVLCAATEYPPLLDERAERNECQCIPATEPNRTEPNRTDFEGQTIKRRKKYASDASAKEYDRNGTYECQNCIASGAGCRACRRGAVETIPKSTAVYHRLESRRLSSTLKRRCGGPVD